MTRWWGLGLALMLTGCQKTVSTRASLTLQYLKGRLCGHEVVSSLSTFDVAPEPTPCSATFDFLLSNGRSATADFHHPVDVSSPEVKTLPRNTLVSQRTIVLRDRAASGAAEIYVENPRRPKPKVDDIATVRWDNPYYVIFRVKSLSQTGALIDFPYGASSNAAEYFFGRQRNHPHYCSGKGKRSGPFSVRVYRDTPSTQQPPTPAMPWTSEALIARPKLLCSHTHKSAFAVRLTDDEVARDPRVPFAVELRVQGQQSRFFRVTPSAHENFTILTVFTEDPR